MSNKEKICLASDNWSPAHPLIMEAMVEANEGYAPSYGADSWTAKAEKAIQEACGSNCKIFIVPTGTGSNILALKLACRHFESVICTDIAHINYHECGACEGLIGSKILTVPHKMGKVTPKALLSRLKHERAFGKHSTSPRVLSITQSTEVGTVYSLDELQALFQNMSRRRTLSSHRWKSLLQCSSESAGLFARDDLCKQCRYFVPWRDKKWLGWCRSSSHLQSLPT